MKSIRPLNFALAAASGFISRNMQHDHDSLFPHWGRLEGYGGEFTWKNMYEFYTMPASK